MNGSLKPQFVAKMIEWEGAAQIPPDGLAKDSIPPINKDIGSVLFSEAIITLAKPNVREQILCVVDSCVVSRHSFNEGAVEFPFYKGKFHDTANHFTRPFLCVVLDDKTALMLEHHHNTVYERLELMEFKGSAEFSHYFDMGIVSLTAYYDSLIRDSIYRTLRCATVLRFRSPVNDRSF